MLECAKDHRATRRQRFWGVLRQFARNRQGNVAVIACVVALPMFMVVGAAVDYARIVHARKQMMSAVDAAALAGGRIGAVDPDALQIAADRTFDANMARAGMEPDFEVHAQYLNEGQTVRVDAGGFLPATIMRALGREHYRIDVTSEVTRASSGGVEVVMVLDNTGSMNPSRIASLRRAALKLVNMLLPGNAPSKTTRVGLVPFVTAVNIRSDTLPGFEGDPEAFSWDWIDVDGDALYHGQLVDGAPGHQSPYKRWVLLPEELATSNGQYVCRTSQRVAGECFRTGERALDAPFTTNYLTLFKNIADSDTLGAGWRGCVEARPGGLDMEDVPPGAPATADYTVADTRWTPWFWPDEPAGSDHTNNYAFDLVTNSLWERQEYVGKYHYDHSLDDARARIHEEPPQKNQNNRAIETGPNRACPRPIVPLTNRKSVLVRELEFMRALQGSGTLIPIGLMWGLRVLSPQPPYTQGVRFNDPDTRKILILLTDGANSLRADKGAQAYNLSDYTSYGFFIENRLGLTHRTTRDFREEMDRRLSRLCNRLNARGVAVYTIMLEIEDDALRDTLRDCASKPQYAFSADNTTLERVFAGIGSSITVSALRVSK